jgi:hypothetical protein
MVNGGVPPAMSLNTSHKLKTFLSQSKGEEDSYGPFLPRQEDGYEVHYVDGGQGITDPSGLLELVLKHALNKFR